MLFLAIPEYSYIYILTLNKTIAMYIKAIYIDDKGKAHVIEDPGDDKNLPEKYAEILKGFKLCAITFNADLTKAMDRKDLEKYLKGWKDDIQKQYNAKDTAKD